jgi:hypothetical protein
MAGPLGEIHDASVPGSSAALFGVPVRVRKNLSEDELRALCRGQFARMFGPLAATPKAEFIKGWALDPYTATVADMDGPAVVLHRRVDNPLRRMAHHVDRRAAVRRPHPHDPDRNGLRLVRQCTGPARCGLEFPVHRWHGLADRYLQPGREARAQAINDMVIFVVGLVCLFGAGGLLEILGWQTMNLVLMPWLGLAAASLVWLGLTTDSGPHLGVRLLKRLSGKINEFAGRLEDR